MKYLSLFSGIGGFELGIQQAYEAKQCQNCDGRGDINIGASVCWKCKGTGVQLQNDTEARRCGQEEDIFERPLSNTSGESNKRQHPTCIGYSEIDRYATQIYQKHFNHKNYGDITKLNTAELPDFDFLCGGFPCQAFSIAGKRKGFEDTRGTLFFEIARILRDKQPRLFLLENVKGLLSHDNGKTFATIISTLDELGYDLQWQVCNSKNFGVPQNRERVFIVGNLRGTRRPKVFPITENSQADIVLPTLTARYYGGQANGGYIGNQTTRTSRQTNQQRGSKSNNINRRGGQTHTPSISQRGHGFFKGSESDVAPSIRGSSVAHNVYVNKIRRLTPVECERLQGFPDGWTEGVSDTQRYKTLGNAVTVNVIKAIIEKIIFKRSNPPLF